MPTPSLAAFSPFATTKFIFFDFIILGKKDTIDRLNQYRDN